MGIDNSVIFFLLYQLSDHTKLVRIQDECCYHSDKFQYGVGTREKKPFWPTEDTWRDHVEDYARGTLAKEGAERARHILKSEANPPVRQAYGGSKKILFKSHIYSLLKEYAMSKHPGNRDGSVAELKDLLGKIEPPLPHEQLDTVNACNNLDGLLKYLINTAEDAARNQTSDSRIHCRKNPFPAKKGKKEATMHSSIDKQPTASPASTNTVAFSSETVIRPMSVSQLLALGKTAEELAAAVMANDEQLYDLPPEVAGSQSQWADIYKHYPDCTTFLTCMDEHGNLQIIGNWTIVPISPEQETAMMEGTLRDIDLVVEENIYSQGVHVGYLLNLSVNMPFHSMRVYRSLWESFTDFLLALAEEGSVFSRIYTKVFRPDHEIRFSSKGFSHMTDDQFYGKVFVIDMTESAASLGSEKLAKAYPVWSPKPSSTPLIDKYWTASVPELVAQGFSFLEIAKSFCRIYQAQRELARQPYDMRYEDPNSLIPLLQAEDGKAFRFLLCKAPIHGADKIIVGFYWITPYSGSLTDIPWEELEFSPPEKIGNSSSLCILAFHILDFASSEEASHCLLSALGQHVHQLCEEAQSPVPSVFVRAFCTREEYFLSENGFTFLYETMTSVTRPPLENTSVFAKVLGGFWQEFCMGKSYFESLISLLFFYYWDNVLANDLRPVLGPAVDVILKSQFPSHQIDHRPADGPHPEQFFVHRVMDSSPLCRYDLSVILEPTRTVALASLPVIVPAEDQPIIAAILSRMNYNSSEHIPFFLDSSSGSDHCRICCSDSHKNNNFYGLSFAKVDVMIRSVVDRLTSYGPTIAESLAPFVTPDDSGILPF